MKRRMLILIALGCAVAATYFATAAWATTKVYYLSPIYMVWQPASSARSGFTGLGWTDNFAQWERLAGGSPSVCLDYVDTNENELKTPACTNTFLNLDSRDSTSYSAPICFANASNTYDLLMANSNGDGCSADHN